MTTTTRRRLLPFLGMSFVSLAVAGRTDFSAQSPTFRTATEVVAVYATVQGPDGRLVTDLTKDDFEVLDNGASVEIAIFSNQPQPITAVIMIDASLSMSMKLPRVRQSLGLFFKRLHAEDRIKIGSFGAEIAVSHGWSNDPDALNRILSEEVWPTGTSPLWRALDTSISALGAEPGRRVILTLTDGVNYITDNGVPELPGGFTHLKRRVEADAALMIYAVGYGDPRRGQRLKGEIVDLTALSGGGHADVPPQSDLATAVAQIGEELRRQYLLGFVPVKVDGRIHRLQVRTRTKGHKARARTSYLAERR